MLKCVLSWIRRPLVKEAPVVVVVRLHEDNIRALAKAVAAELHKPLPPIRVLPPLGE